MKRYTFEVVIHEGSDEFWESQPTETQVKDLIIEALEVYGMDVQREGGYIHTKDTVTFVKMERI